MKYSEGDGMSDSMEGSTRPTSRWRTGLSINNRSKSIGKSRRKSRQPGKSSDMIAWLRDLFNKAKTVEKGNKSGAEDDNLQSCIQILNELDVPTGLYKDAVTRFIEVPSTRTDFIFIRVDGRISWLNKTLRHPLPPPQYSHHPAHLDSGYRTPLNHSYPTPTTYIYHTSFPYWYN